MTDGAWITRGTIWLALVLYAAAEWTRAGRNSQRASSLARWLMSLGCATLLAHVAAAFHFHHHWSHAAAYAETARQTAELFGWNWGGGLYFNYAFALVWVIEVIWWWANPAGYLQRARGVTCGVRALFFFMVFNGAVIFLPPPARWLGLILCLSLAASWLWGAFLSFRPVRGAC